MDNQFEEVNNLQGMVRQTCIIEIIRALKVGKNNKV